MPTKQIGKVKVYYKGNWDEALFSKCMGIVGSRRMTSYGQRVVEKIVPGLVFDDWTIVSGFMYGVDIAAHEATLACGGKTIAVLGWGIDVKLEGKELVLEEKIIETGGLIISLWEDQLGTNWTFPARNKVVANICHELIVVEAAIKSGALLTATMVRNLKKPVWAVPGPITSSVSAGTNNLIATGQASPWTQPTKSSSDIKSPILSLLQNEPLDAGEIARTLGVQIDKITADLTMLSLEGFVKEKEGKFYAGEN